MEKYSFPYAFKLEENGKIRFFPSVSIYFQSKTEKKIFALLVVDSGADITFLTYEDAIALGIELEKGKETLVAGITPSTTITGYRHNIKIKFNQLNFEIPVVFANSNEVPRVLGREGIFDKFFILFDEKSKQTIFIRRDADSEKKLKSIL